MARFLEKLLGRDRRVRVARGGAVAAVLVLVPASVMPGALTAVSAGGGAPPEAAAASHGQQDTTRRRQSTFSHGEHRGVPCSSCHSGNLRHGAVRIRGAESCSRCHHTGAGRDQCATCHSPEELAQPTARVPKTFRLAVSDREVSRRIAFPHPPHSAVPCTMCHADPQTRAPNTGQCGLCHAPHHRAESNCRACHGEANPRESHRAAAHPNCAVSGCHGTRAPDIAPSRQACLLCHADRDQHMPGMVCSQCHRVTNPETRQ